VSDQIQKCAERAISLLRGKRYLNVLLFPELLGERSVVAYQALGWLAREGRVRYSMKARQCYLSLAEGAERPHEQKKG
jgi:hypothetical protein